jgi:hypothetical protein
MRWVTPPFLVDTYFAAVASLKNKLPSKLASISNTEVAIPPNKAACPLCPRRHVGSIEIYKNGSLVIELLVEHKSCVVMFFLGFGEDK